MTEKIRSIVRTIPVGVKLYFFPTVYLLAVCGMLASVFYRGEPVSPTNVINSWIETTQDAFWKGGGNVLAALVLAAIAIFYLWFIAEMLADVQPRYSTSQVGYNVIVLSPALLCLTASLWMIQLQHVVLSFAMAASTLFLVCWGFIHLWHRWLQTCQCRDADVCLTGIVVPSVLVIVTWGFLAATNWTVDWSGLNDSWAHQWEQSRWLLPVAYLGLALLVFVVVILKIDVLVFRLLKWVDCRAPGYNWLIILMPVVAATSIMIWSLGTPHLVILISSIFYNFWYLLTLTVAQRAGKLEFLQSDY